MGLCIHCEERLETDESGLCDRCADECAEETRKAAEDEVKRAAELVRMKTLAAAAESAGRLGFDVRTTDWGVYIDGVFLTHFQSGGLVPEALFLRALKMIDKRETPDA